MTAMTTSSSTRVKAKRRRDMDISPKAVAQRRRAERTPDAVVWPRMAPLRLAGHGRRRKTAGAKRPKVLGQIAGRAAREIADLRPLCGGRRPALREGGKQWAGVQFQLDNHVPQRLNQVAARGAIIVVMNRAGGLRMAWLLVRAVRVVMTARRFDRGSLRWAGMVVMPMAQADRHGRHVQRGGRKGNQASATTKHGNRAPFAQFPRFVKVNGGLSIRAY